MVNPSQLLGYITRDGAPADVARLRPCPYPCEPDAKPVAIRHEGGPLKPMHQNDKSLGAPGKVGRKPALPPFWDPELYGEAFGDFQGGRKKIAEAGGRQRLGDKARDRRISSTLGRRLEKLTDAMLAALQKRKNLHGG
jgi:hypothetical protein